MGKHSLRLFGRTPSYQESEIIVLAVPWSVTSSFGSGAEYGPEVLAYHSSQMDFFSPEWEDIRDHGIFFKAPPDSLKILNQQTRSQALPIVQLEEEAPGDFSTLKIEEINKACAQMVEWVYTQVAHVYQDRKKCGLIGGDHSITEGAVRYFSEKYRDNLGILHIDAHGDLRKSYQGFRHSHASVMYNVIHYKYSPSCLIQVGIRDYCEEEFFMIQNTENIHTFFDSQIKADMFEGKTWCSIVKSIIHQLPQRVYISLDVDGLKPHLFPHTGTPVPGGLSFEQLEYLLLQINRSDSQIVGFDLVEVASPQGKLNLWDGQVGARLLYKLSQLLMRSN